jgi:citrate lyase subunit beta/citryl-CoA lyase
MIQFAQEKPGTEKNDHKSGAKHGFLPERAWRPRCVALRGYRMPAAMLTPCSWLFVPGDTPAKIAKAAASEADAVILDLEDSVALSRKDTARETVADALTKMPPAFRMQYWIRINPLSRNDLLADLAVVAAGRPDGIVLPKCDSAVDVIKLSEELDKIESASSQPPGRIKILPIATETPQSLFNLGTYQHAGPRLAGLTWGAEDLPAAVGATASRNADGSLSDLCRLARSLCLAGAAAANVAAIETVYPDFRDLQGLHDYAVQGRRDGFVGMMAIHPAQVPVIHAVMTPSETEIAYAHEVVALFEAHPDKGVVALNGKMLDLPHLTQARRTLARGRRQ